MVEPLRGRGASARWTLLLPAVLLLTLAPRLWRLDQPIVENYVGRQVPTAMAARNLERGSGFLRPELDTGPFPNRFLVEPPAFGALAVGLRRLTGLDLPAAGRLASALATALGAWGLFGLVRRREGPAPATVAALAFASFPILLRYGRAFQPDAAMLGCQLAALRCWDEGVSGRGLARFVLGGILLSTGLALKITSAVVVFPTLAVLQHSQRRADPPSIPPSTIRQFLLALGALLPALLWYGHAAWLLSSGEGSRASADNGRIWLGVLVPSALIEPETYSLSARYLLVRAFTPIGAALAAWGLWRGGPDRLWVAWGLSSMALLIGLAGKAHHEYYWMVLAPVAAVGVSRGLFDLARRGPFGTAASALVGLGLLGMSFLQAADTWRTPPEWAALPAAAEAVRRHVPPGDWVVAPEALLFAADRRGCRLEPPGPPAARAAGEWRGTLEDPDDPIALVEFYRLRGARYLADLTPAARFEDPARAAKHAEIRRRYRILADGDGFLLAELKPEPTTTAPEGTPHGDREPDPEPDPRAPVRAPRPARHPAGPGADEGRGAQDRHAHGL